MKRKLISLLMAGTLALSLAACGGSSFAPAADSNADAAAEETQAEGLMEQYGFTITYFEDSPTMYNPICTPAIPSHYTTTK